MFGFEGDNAREKGIVLLTMCFALAMAMLDNTVVNVALPTIRNDLGAGFSQLQWIVDAYALAFASLLLTGGILGDRYGRKRMFLAGLTVFTVFSLACGLSTTPTQLIVARALQGIGGALLIPGTLSIITVTFPPHERAKALGLWAGVSGIALALGPTLGGYMVEHLGWESVFFLNVPIGIIAFLVAMSTVRESRSEEQRQLDIVGLILGTSALFFVTYGLIEANALGWSDIKIIASLLLFVVLIVAFLRWELKNPHALMPLRFFKIPAFSAGNTVAFSISLGMFATFFFLTIYMQTIHGYSPFQAGAAFLPLTVMIIVTAPNAGKYASTHGSRAPMTYGLCLAGGGLILLGLLLTPTTPYWLMFPIFLFMGHGMGATMAPMTAAVMNSVGRERAGLGSAMTNTSREVGGVLGSRCSAPSSPRRSALPSRQRSPNSDDVGADPNDRRVRPARGALDSRTLAPGGGSGSDRVQRRVHAGVPARAAVRRRDPVGCRARVEPIHPRSRDDRGASRRGRRRRGGPRPLRL